MHGSRHAVAILRQPHSHPRVQHDGRANSHDGLLAREFSIPFDLGLNFTDLQPHSNVVISLYA
ncbi:21b1ba2b-6003-45e6-b919-e79d6068527c [Thermothielavioides terrestris]|uniref:21b1ba2b-6003-45e6-b919-e79d6068527c n=1 Tax=Thermothielavioides terrestris TaxID=2587410 RepID=A0A446BLN4_9PEZI|nr:21b1ba2b-6003-45e6-b919-e79d6068527c [Thermothielavioides terrestris]